MGRRRAIQKPTDRRPDWGNSPVDAAAGVIDEYFQYVSPRPQGNRISKRNIACFELEVVGFVPAWVLELH
jgi:hypothetical protein